MVEAANGETGDDGTEMRGDDMFVTLTDKLGGEVHIRTSSIDVVAPIQGGGGSRVGAFKGEPVSVRETTNVVLERIRAVES